MDGAFGLWAAASPRTRHLISGYEAADSWVSDGHKWLNTPYDCGFAICRWPQAVHAVMATVAPYLKAGEVAAPKDMVPEFSRSARGIEVWAALRSLGRGGVADLVERCCRLARLFADELRAAGFEILNDVVLNQVVATLPGREEQMPEISARVRAGGEAWFGPTRWRGVDAIRLSVSSWVTTEEDVHRTVAAIRAAIP
ncbi:pyridoxal-dependent decarboxylase [Xanthobacter autotrophicus]|uniref:pyridoxal phosphate-dependent decarboxylase family protein n=1 Tax=Xanthobacter autotrophicus TaxID=280 RepID=UPI003726CF2E